MEKQVLHLLSPEGLVLLIIAVVIVLLIVCMYFMYVGLIQKKNTVAEAFSDVDVQLKKRYDLIPNILTIANKFMEHERGLLEGITALRSQAANMPNDMEHAKEKFELDGKISSMMGQFKLQVENYPQLKSDQTMMQAMQTYNTQEEHIAAARNFYNSAVKELNNAVEIFPSSFVALLVGVKQAPFIEATATERQRIDAREYFN
jgi:LemA protein